jgi:hypothetical protein
MIERYHIKERNDITQPREENRKTNRGIDPNTDYNSYVSNDVLKFVSF